MTDQLPEMPLQLIDDPDRLAATCDRFADTRSLGLDTEFMRERTYYPRLCLVQLAAEGEVACIDPLALEGRLQPLMRLLESEDVVKVFHASRQDLEVLLPVLGRVPEPLFDTQVAAALCGHADQVSYAGLVESVLEVSLEKGHTRTDWCRRPLSEAQLRYAADDVRFLGALHGHLHRRLEALGRLAWMREEMGALVRLATRMPADEDMYTRVNGARTLDAPGQHRLSRLAAWRERQARERDLPREWVLPDAALLAMANDVPADAEALSRMPGVGDRRAGRYAAALLQALRDSKPVSSEPLLEAARPLTGPERAACARLMEAVRARASVLGVAAPLLATRREVEALVRGSRNGSVTSGWRREAVGEVLLEMLERGR